MGSCSVQDNQLDAGLIISAETMRLLFQPILMQKMMQLFEGAAPEGQKQQPGQE